MTSTFYGDPDVILVDELEGVWRKGILGINRDLQRRRLESGQLTNAFRALFPALRGIKPGHKFQIHFDFYLILIGSLLLGLLVNQ